MLRVLVSLIFLALSTTARADAPVTVFAAASMREAMEEIGAAFKEDTGTEVVFSFAGTGTIARQIEAGAPADVFVSADIAWMDYVIARDAVREQTVTNIAGNALVIIGAGGSAALDLTENVIADRLSGERMAMADPETVPAGRYGKTALESLGLWDFLEVRLALMENVRVALASVARGDTPLGLVYATDAAIEPDVAVVATIPADSYPPIIYPAAVTTVSSHEKAQAFLDYLTQPQATKILQSFGFVTDNGQ